MPSFDTGGRREAIFVSLCKDFLLPVLPRTRYLVRYPRQADCSDSNNDRWNKRIAADRLTGLFARHRGRDRYKVTDRLEAQVRAHDQAQARQWVYAGSPPSWRSHLAHDGGSHLGQARRQAASVATLAVIQ